MSHLPLVIKNSSNSANSRQADIPLMENNSQEKIQIDIGLIQTPTNKLQINLQSQPQNSEFNTEKDQKDELSNNNNTPQNKKLEQSSLPTDNKNLQQSQFSNSKNRMDTPDNKSKGGKEKDDKKKGDSTSRNRRASIKGLLNIGGKSKKQEERKDPKKYQRVEEDFTQEDYNRRNILHRAALEQNVQLIQEIIDEYKKIKQMDFENYNNKDIYINDAIYDYINKQDLFSNTPLLLCCVQHLEDRIEQKRMCLELLINYGAEVNYQNKRTLWTSLHWCAHYGNKDCIQLLIDRGAKEFLPDFEGQFPIDLAGKTHYVKELAPIIEIFVKKSNERLNKLEESKASLRTQTIRKQYEEEQEQEGVQQSEQDKIIDKSQLKDPNKVTPFQESLNGNGFSQKENIQIEESPSKLKSKKDTFKEQNKKVEQLQQKFLISPYYKLSLIFWAIYHSNPQDNSNSYEKSFEYIKQIYNYSCVYMEAPVYFMFNMTPLHAAAKNGMHDVLEYYFHQKNQKPNMKEQEMKKRANKLKDQNQYDFNIHDNTILRIIPSENDLYQQHFKRNIEKLARWENKYILNFLMKADSKKCINYLNCQDLFGNTPLHLASICGKKKCVELLLKNKSDYEIENNEGWRPRELIQQEGISEQYQNFIQQQKLTDNSASNNAAFQQLQRALKEAKITDFQQKDESMDLINYAPQIIVPDFVIKLELPEPKNTNEIKINGLPVNPTQLNRVNNQISFMIKQSFETNIMKSIDNRFYYILLTLPIKNLEYECKNLKMEMKLIDSYDYEQYDPKYNYKFEPFRSRQRQEIIEAKLKKIINLQDLIKQNLISTFYKMHTYGGTYRIKQQWIEQPKWFWPQPLNQIADYLLEGINQNFSSLTRLRQYFGEKISFFFAWKSYTTCTLFILAVPGIALQIYILYSRNFNHWLVPFWVFYVTIWSTFIVEFWKRKTSELNYRWGSLDQMNNPDLLDKMMREEFLGDMCISTVTGELTKYQEKGKTLIVVLISIPVVCGLMFAVVLTFLLVENYKDTYGKTSSLHKTLAGVFQGISITILNLVYVEMIHLFAKWENHKYVAQYERSLIYKGMAFKVLNSYFAIFYVAFVQKESNFETLFYMLLPIMLVKQANYLALNVVIPKLKYWWKERKYFQKIAQLQTEQEHKLAGKQLDEDEFYQDKIEIFYHSLGPKMKTAARSVLNLNNPKKIQQVQSEDVDSIELNSLRLDFDPENELINYYAEGFIDIGYIILFAAAFPLGPAVALLMNILEIRNRVTVLLYILRRPTCKRSTGIGEWLNIWELMSFVSVFTNFALLYVKNTDIFEYLFGPGNVYDVDETSKMWFYIVVIVFIVFIKYIFQVVIKDKPEWVKKEEDRAAFLKNAEQEQREAELNEGQQKFNKKKEMLEQKEYERQKHYQQKDIQHEREIMMLKEKNLHMYNLLPAKYKEQFNNDQKQQKIIQEEKQKVETEFQIQQFGMIRSIYILYEREILIQRIGQIVQANEDIVLLCNECSKNYALIECVDCNEVFCNGCFDKFHQLIKQKNHNLKLLRTELAFANLDLQNKGNLLPMRKKVMNLVTNEADFTITGGNGRMVNAGTQKKWRKFEYFALPTFEKGEHFAVLQEVYDILKQDYIVNNGLDQASDQIDFMKFFRIVKEKDAFYRQETKQLKEFLDMGEFNVEDKLFLNRIAFLTFKKYGAQAKFDHFKRLCKVIQEGNLEQKIKIFMDILDEDNSNTISKEEVNKIFLTSFLQDTEAFSKIHTLVQQIFDQRTSLKKSELANRLTEQLHQDSNMKEFVAALLQIR